MWYTIGTLIGVGLAYLINPLELFRARRQYNYDNPRLIMFGEYHPDDEERL